MVALSVSIEVSSEQIISGIPKTVTLSTNLPASIFYTLDESTPTEFSTIYTSSIYLPRANTVILKVIAFDGVSFSSVLTETYQTDLVSGNLRYPHSDTSAIPGSNISNLYPYGTNENQPNSIYLNPGGAGTNVYDPNSSSVSGGFDGSGNANNFSNLPFNSENYEIKYSTSDSNNQTGRGIGTLPGQVNVLRESDVPETTEQFSSTMFDPRAMVIFQDLSKENPADPPQINKQFFSSERDVTRDGNAFYTTGLDAPPVNGSFVKSFFNPRDNTMTYYYFEPWVNKWIISKQPFVANPNVQNNLSGTVSGRGAGAQWVFEWIPGQRRVLF